jgi:micrococcal nuclease
VLTALWLVPLLLVAGALFDPALIEPIGPFASAPERVTARFTQCSRGRGPACVSDGDSFRLGDRRIRITGIDAPELGSPSCPAEAALARKSADRLRQLLSAGEFDMIGHRFHRRDRHGRDLMVLRRNGQSIGKQLIAEGLAHRYIGSKRSWCE